MLGLVITREFSAQRVTDFLLATGENDFVFIIRVIQRGNYSPRESYAGVMMEFSVESGADGLAKLLFLPRGFVTAPHHLGR